MSRILSHPIKVSEDVWLELIKRKYAGRYRSIDEPMREALGLPLREPAAGDERIPAGA